MLSILSSLDLGGKLLNQKYIKLTMLSKIDIKKRVEKGDLEVEPWQPGNLKPASLAVHLDNQIAVSLKGEIDPLSEEDYSKHFEKKELKKGETFKLKPGEFILARTSESFGLPKDLAMLLDGKTTLARLGVSVTQGAMLIHPGSGKPKPRKVILEIKNDGPFTVQFTEEMQIGEVFFHELDNPTDVGYDEEWAYGNREDLDELIPAVESF